MKKRSIAAVNCLLTVFIFLCVYGNTCYRAALSGKGGSDFGQQIALCVYYAGLVIISVCCICIYPYYSNKCFWIGAVYAILYHVLCLILLLFTLIFESWRIGTINWLHWICLLLPPVISGLYLYAALKKE